jgi:aspartate racemase
MSPHILPFGLIGGMSAESTKVYYRRLIELSREELGGARCPRLVIVNVDFEQVVEWQHADRWDLFADAIGAEMEVLAAAGCAFAAIAANTPHKVLPEIRPPIPVLSILDAVADGARARGVRRIGLTGTRFTMEDGFYARGLEERGFYGVVPLADERDEIHRIIYQELTRGRVEAGSVARFAEIVRGLLDGGADTVLLGCTELPLLAGHPAWPADLPPLLDSTEEHVRTLFRASTGLGLESSPSAAALRERLAVGAA